MSSNEYLAWTELIEEVKSYYNNYDELFENIKNNECAVFCSMISEIEQCLIFSLEWKKIIFRLHNNHEFEDKIAQYYVQWNPFYFVIGHTLEGIFKFIFIRDDLEHYIENIKNKDKNKSLLKFDLAKNRIIELLHEKNINEKKIDRCKNIFQYIQIQRNNTAHFPFREFDDYGVYAEIFSLIYFFIDTFDISVSDSMRKKLMIRIKYEKEHNGLFDFEDVGFFSSGAKND